MMLIRGIIVLILTTCSIATAPPIDIVFIIQNQTSTKYHYEISRNLKENLIKQSLKLQPNYRIHVHLLDEIFNYPGGWTIHNLIGKLMLDQRKSHLNTNIYDKTTTTTVGDCNTEKYIDTNIINENTRWIVFCDTETRINVKLLMERLNNENHTQALFLGHPLYDREPTIIHHFAFFENPKWFPYPMLRAGVVFSMSLLKRIAEIYNSHQKNSNAKQKSSLLQRSEFSIDAAHELAIFIYDNIQILTEATTYENFNEIKNVHIKATKIPAHSLKNPAHTDAATAKGKEDNSYSFDNNILENVAKDNSIKRKKIILKKASYICPMTTWETGSTNSKYIKNIRKSNVNKNKYDNNECAMYAVPSTICIPIKRDEIYFAVKTCSKYHNERLPVIQATWGQYAKHIKYFSDKEDNTWSTTNTGIPNVEMGHCVKTLKILKLALKDIENYNSKHESLHHLNSAGYEDHQIKWLFLTDDDTLLSVSGVCQVLGCYNSMDEIYLGERYGYRLYAQDGFNYITGGGGIAMSLSVVKLILQNCNCPSASAPDDMILGSCLHTLQIKALHSSRFHQARPNDYPLELLKLEAPISFHKFWQHDPIDTYDQWFASADRELLTEELSFTENSVELNYRSKTRKLLSKPETLELNEMPANLMASLHHSKERHLDL